MDYVDEIFADRLIDLDGNSFKNCRFEGCILRYGGGDLHLSNPSFVDRNRVEFVDGVDPKDNPLIRFLEANVLLAGGHVGTKGDGADHPQVTPKKDLG